LTTGSTCWRTCDPPKMHLNRCDTVFFLMAAHQPLHPGRTLGSGTTPACWAAMTYRTQSEPGILVLMPGSMTFQGHSGMSDIGYTA
jgi:hypothetical protein